MLPKQIHIPNPCHEDWSKMTPTEKGAFCSSCKKEVLDFTKSSNEEIRESLAEEIEPCIRITQKKLDEMNFLEWFNHLRLRIQLNYVFLFGFLVAQSSLMAQESISHEPRFVAVDSIDQLSFEELTADLLYYPLEEEAPYYSFIWNPFVLNDSITFCDLPVGGTPIIWGWGYEEETEPFEPSEYHIEVTDEMGSAITYGWLEPDLNVIPSLGTVIYNGPVFINEGNANLWPSPYMDKTASQHEKLKVGFNTFEFEIIENQLYFSYDAHQDQDIHLKIGQDQYGPFASSQNNILFSGPLSIRPGNKSIIIPLNGYLSGTYFIQINSGHLQDRGRLIFF
jgi:hypothetical protein